MGIDNIDPREEYSNWEAPKGEGSSETLGEAYERYARQLGLDEAILAGKRILDVGSNEANFKKYLEEKYSGTEVVSIDKVDYPGVAVRASAEDLPFKKESFDVVVAHALPLYPDQLVRSAEEYLKVSKVGGEIRIGPLWKGREGEPSGESWEKLHNFLQSAGKKVVIQDIPIGEREFPDGKEMQYCVVVKKLA